VIEIIPSELTTSETTTGANTVGGNLEHHLRTRRPGELWRLLAIPLLALTVLPLVALLLRSSPAQSIANLRLPQVQQAISLSLGTTLITLGVTTVFGAPIAYWLTRGTSWRSRLVDSLVDLPTVLPPAVAGVALLMAFGRRGLLGGVLNTLGIQIAFTSAAVILAQTFVAAPYFIRSAVTGFSGISNELKQAAELDGASNWQVFRYVIVPLAGPSLISGAVMSWARALGEFGATMIFAGNFPGRTQTMPLAIYLGFEIDLNVALTLSVILLMVSFVTLLIVKGLLHRELR
jgi:molybdate transport system permease protein